MSGRLTVFVRANPAGRGRLLAILRADAAAAAAEPGCAHFSVSQDVLDPDRFVICEDWASRKALEEHFAHDHYRAVIEALEDPGLVAGVSHWAGKPDA